MDTNVQPERRAGRPIDEGKRTAVLKAAQQLFLSHGFAGTSMDAIAEAAGVSKLTAYKYFGSKQELFARAFVQKCASAFSSFDVEHLADHGLRDRLIGFGHAFLALILDPEALAVHRLVIAERDRAPELGRLYFENAIRPTADRLATIIARHKEAGEVATDGDPLSAAQDLLALWRGRPFLMIEIGYGPIGSDVLAAHIDHCVDLCLRAWLPRD